MRASKCWWKTIYLLQTTWWSLLTLTVSAIAYEPGDPIPDKRVAVIDLNISGEYSDQVRHWLPALIEDRLLKEGWTLVVRGERLRPIREEYNLPGVKPETRLPDNELLGATAFLELNARVQVKDIQGVVGFKYFTLGDYARATVDLNGQIIDPATGVLKSSVSVGGSAAGLKTALVVTLGDDWRIGAGGYNLRGVRETLVGKAADEAASRLVDKLKALYPSIPGRNTPASMAKAKALFVQPASTTIVATSTERTILIELPDTATPQIGDRYGVWRGDKLIAEVEIIRLAGKRAEAKIIQQELPIQPTDVARRIPMVIKAE